MTQLLLDTNIVLWLSEDTARVNSIKPLLLSRGSQVFISTVTWWEIAIKKRAGKLAVDLEYIRSYARRCDFHELPITGSCMEAYLGLPDIHKDPFDHMLLAQAISTPMRLITGNSLLAEYSSLVMVV